MLVKCQINYSETRAWDWTKCCLISMQCPCWSLVRKPETKEGLMGGNPEKNKIVFPYIMLQNLILIECQPPSIERCLVILSMPCSGICKTVIQPASFVCTLKLVLLSSYNPLYLRPDLPLMFRSIPCCLLKDFTPEILSPVPWSSPLCWMIPISMHSILENKKQKC